MKTSMLNSILLSTGSLLVALSLYAFAEMPDASHSHHGMRPFDASKVAALRKQHEEEFTKELNLSSAQQDQITQIKKDAENQTKPLRDELSQKRKDFMQYLSSPQANVDDALTKKQDMASLHDQLSELHIRTLFKVRGVLTPEQQAKAASLRQKRMDDWKQHRQEGQKPSQG